jgi:hypothetical protein
VKQFTIFTWGYWGWGNVTSEIVQLIDSVEVAKGFQPPLFIDIRISRSVRAKGFNGSSFGDLLGPNRYRHMPSLGNLAVIGHPGPSIQIKEPDKVHALLDLAIKLNEGGQRVIFFCSCEFPYLEGQEEACHRVTVARLLLEAAQERRVPVEIVEWPGGEPRSLDLWLAPNSARKVLRGGKSVPLESNASVEQFADLPWGSIIQVRSDFGEFPVAVGPPKRGRDRWYLPIPWDTANHHAIVSDLHSKVRGWRRNYGFEPRSTPLKPSQF